VNAPDAAVRIRGLVRRFGATTAVDGIDLDVARGETFGLIGPDGAGKTTTLRSILGLLAPSSGVVRTLGVDPTAQRRRLSRRVGYLAQSFSLYGDLSIAENIAFFAAVFGVRGWRARRDELLDLLRLTPFRDRLAERLSGGMKQKLALACTLIHTPELLVLDEPTTGVDPVSRRDFWKILARLQRDGLTLVLTTPYLDEAERCTRVALMDRGRLLTSDTPARIRDRWPGVLLEILVTPKRPALEWLRARPGVGSVETFGERLHAAFPDVARDAGAETAAALTADLRAGGFEVRGVRPVVPTLEDVFISRIRATDDEPVASEEAHP